MKEHIKSRLFERDMLVEYVSKTKALEIMQNQIAELEKNIDALDEDIEELEDSGLDRTVEILCKTRNSLNLERLELEIHICKLRLWLAEFERDMLIEYVSKAKALEVMQTQIVDLENLIEAFDKDIEELDGAGLNRTVEILCKTRNSLNLERLELEIHICKLRLWLAEFELERQLAR